MTALLPGRCRHCGCTELSACMLATGEACCWTDRERLVCSNPSCIRAEAARKAAARAPQPRKRTPGDIYQLQIEERRRRRRGRARQKGRAA